MLPVTCRMLSTAVLQPDDHYAFDGIALSQVTMVALVEHVEENATNCTYKVSDGTGSVDVRIWITQDDQGYIDSKRHEWREGAYVRIYGIVRSWQKQLSIVAYRLMVVQDPNEITFHLLETMHVFAGMKAQGADHSSGMGNLGAAPAGMFSGSSAGGQSLYGGVQSSGTSQGSAVFEIVQRFSSLPAYKEHGPSRTDIQQAMQSRMNSDQVNSALEFLLEDGQLFTTIDDHHFKLIQ
eukprot:ANDGO_02107.mRNA.1 Replication factor A protein 2